MKDKVLIFHPAVAPYRIDFFNALNEKFRTHFYFYFKNVPDQKFNQDILKERSTFKSNYLNKGVNLFGRSFRLGVFSIIKKVQPDIVLCSEYGQVTLFVFFYSKLFNRKLKIYTISDDSIDNSKSRRGLRSFLRNLISKNINGVIFSSKDVANWYKENINKETKTLELPIIHSEQSLRTRYIGSIDKANTYINQYNLKGRKVILYVGRLVEVKNIPLLINSFSKINKDECILVIVGDGPLRNSLEKLCAKLDFSDKIIFTGRKEEEELYAWYLVANLFVLPSTYEPFGAVVNEALIAGCNVLCSNLAGASTLIESKNGLTFDPSNEMDLSLKLENLLQKSEPVRNNILQIRNSKMPFTFKEKINALFRQL